MLLGAGEVATQIARFQLGVMRHRETCGTALANGKVERLVGQRTGGGQVAQGEGDLPPPKHRIDELREGTAVFGQCRYSLGRLHRFRCSIPSRELKHPHE